MSTKTNILLFIGIILFSNTLFSQNENIYSGWIGPVKNIATSPNNHYISVVGENYIHLFDSDKLNQVAIIKNAKKPKNSLFYSDNTLIVIDKQKTYSYNIVRKRLTTLTNKVYNCGYVEYSNNQIYLVSDKNLDVYKDLKLVKSITLNEKYKSITSTNKYLILGSQNGNIRIYKKQDFSVVKTLVGHKTGVNALSVNDSNGKLLSGASRDYRKGEFGEAILWDIETGKILFRTNDNHKQVISVCLYANKMYVSSLRNINIYTLNGELRKNITTYPYTDPVFTISNNKIIYGIADIGHTSEYLHEIDLNSPNFIERIFSHDSRQIWDINFSNNHLIITKDNEVSVLKTDGQVLTYPIFSHSKDVIYKNPPQIIGIGLEKNKLADNLLFQDINTIKPTYIPISSDLKSKRFSADFITFKSNTYSLTNDGLQNLSKNDTLIDFEIPDSTNGSLFDLINEDDFFNVRSPIRKFVTNNSDLLFYEYDRLNFVLNIRNAKNGVYLKQIKNVKRILSQQENQLIYLKSSNDSIKSIDLKNISVQTTVKFPNALKLYKAKYSSNKELIAGKYGKYGNKIIIFNSKTDQITTINPKAKHVDCFAFTPNNRYLLTGNRYGEIEIWDVKNGGYIGIIFTGSLKNDYVIILDESYCGTDNGIKNFIRLEADRFNSA
ncbi:MAG: hypothetical protein CSA39_04470 [Flavobacteriales bacterium]|nr:MAG: hypothetical protein CSA39_04470 [Flavobacteriales bacterium]